MSAADVVMSVLVSARLIPSDVTAFQTRVVVFWLIPDSLLSEVAFAWDLEKAASKI